MSGGTFGPNYQCSDADGIAIDDARDPRHNGEMAAKKPKFYVVWQGRRPGVYRTWDACQNQINGFSAAKYKSFTTLQLAEKAFAESADATGARDLHRATDQDRAANPNRPRT